MKPLTPKQKSMLDLIRYSILANGYAPSYEELAQLAGLSSLATVHKHIITLATKGYIRWHYNQSRSIEIVDTSVDALREENEQLRAQVQRLGGVA